MQKWLKVKNCMKSSPYSLQWAQASVKKSPKTVDKWGWEFILLSHHSLVQGGSRWFRPKRSWRARLAGGLAPSSPRWSLLLPRVVPALAGLRQQERARRTRTTDVLLRKCDGSCFSLPPNRIGEILVLGCCRGAGACEHVHRGLLFQKRSMDATGD